MNMEGKGIEPVLIRGYYLRASPPEKLIINKCIINLKISVIFL
jgi:hypothetical protein